MTNYMLYQTLISHTDLDTAICVDTVNFAGTVEMQHILILRSVVLPDLII